MRKIWRRIMVLGMIMATLIFSGCSPYASSFRTTACVTTNTSDQASISFSTFEGTRVFTVKVKGDDEGILEYSGKLGAGSAKVYYDADGTKKELFAVEAGKEVKASLDDLGKGKVYLILETDGKCEEGRFEFNLK